MGIRSWFKSEPRTPSTGDAQDNEGETGAQSNPSSSTPISFPDGVKMWHPNPNAKVDICFVHGLTGNRDSTWTYPGHAEPWPKTLLPKDLPDARLLTFGYDAYVVNNSVASNNRLNDHASNFMNDLCRGRASAGAQGRPIILVAHSLGGLVCKKAILRSRDNPDRRLRDLFDSVRGIIFMGTPHKGSWMADWAKVPAGALGVVKSVNKSLLQILQTENQLLEDVQITFWEMMRQQREGGRELEVVCFFEELGLPVVGPVVSKTSATLEGWQSLSIHANHANMVKFPSEEHNGYIGVKDILWDWQNNVSHRISEDDNLFLQIFSPASCRSNPYYYKQTVVDNRGGLLKECYSWVLRHERLRRWRNDDQSRLLWIHGDPGKGKTMLLCGVIDHLSSQGSGSAAVSYFFCTEADEQLNNATAVARGIIFTLLESNPQLIPSLRAKYQTKAITLFKSVDAWVILSEVLTDILQHPRLAEAFIVIDALDECRVGRQELLKFLVEKASTLPSGIKFVVSSRNWPAIEEQLNTAPHAVGLSLEENAAEISSGIATYIDLQVQNLAELKQYDDGTKAAIKGHLSRHADGTFLWVAMVCRVLKQTPNVEALHKLDQLPSELDGMYKTMLQQVFDSDSKDLCVSVLALMATVYTPVAIAELPFLVHSELLADKPRKNVEELVKLCGSFLVVREEDGMVAFIHQSAKDFLLSSYAHPQLFPSGIKEVHYSIFSAALRLMSPRLRGNMHEISQPGMLVGEVTRPENDPLACMSYACMYWMSHACDAIDAGQALLAPDTVLAFVDEVLRFLDQHFLHWLESLSLLGGVRRGVLSVRRLLAAVQTGEADQEDEGGFFQAILGVFCAKEDHDGNSKAKLVRFLTDARSFVTKNASVIEKAPLQFWRATRTRSSQQSSRMMAR
ncbi:hypothetical protein F5144DRAFT_161070 [Chaetomium tenue]|uniref:Uncharacterized protein n=1 Tax=Chaetomium tenue TaxID=1854479 RepID=A0ACB7PCC0_9PEZI|nr:hypothetical protein F5144DRAFT_161070 [Chaetomium globosum]